MKNNKRKSNILPVVTNSKDSRGSESSARLPSDYSLPTLKVKGVEEYQRTISFDVQMTVRFKVDFTRKQLCMLTGIALSDVMEQGIGLSDWIVLETLYSTLLGNKQSYSERKDNKEFELTLLLKVVLLSGTWMGLEEKRQLPEDIKSLLLLSRYIPKGRTKTSWKQHWDIAKYIEIRSVPLDFIMERSPNTIPYSSYCKGYGESSRMGRRQKTRPSAELDGEPVEQVEYKSNLTLDQILLALSAVQLEIRYSKIK